MTKRWVGVDAAAITPSFPLFGDVANVQKAGDYLPCGPLSDADGISHVPGSDTGMASNML